MIISQSQLRQELRTGVSGIYLFYGDEDYLKSFYSGRIKKNVLGDGDDADSWNSHIIVGSDDGSPHLDDLDEAVHSVPLMGGKIYIQYNVSISALNDTENEQLLSIISEVDIETTVLVIICPEDGFDPGKKKPSKCFNNYNPVAKIICLSEGTPAELKKWMERRLASDKLQLSADAGDALIERCGHSMSVLSGELDKLAAYALANGITTADASLVTQVTSITEEDKAFALANAILEGDRRRALSVLHIHKAQKEPALRVLASVTRSICDMMTVSCLMSEGADKSEIASKTKMHEYRVGLYMNAVRQSPPERLIAAALRCREADLALKSSSLDYIALERLVCTIPSGKRAVAK